MAGGAALTDSAARNATEQCGSVMRQRIAASVETAVVRRLMWSSKGISNKESSPEDGRIRAAQDCADAYRRLLIMARAEALRVTALGKFLGKVVT
ncbi:MAG: hypothetical protein ACRYHA_08380 [Janthinobacterium lividum]